MNLVIANENMRVINNLNIDILKILNGVFDVNMLEKELVNFYFNKVIIDITAIKNYFITFDLFEFLDYFGKDKVILLLNDSEYCDSKEFLTKLINNGYYNFTKNAQGISFLVNRSNTYDDVKKYIRDDKFTSVLNQPVQNEVKENRPKQSNQKIIGIRNLSRGAGATTLMYMFVKGLSVNYKVKGIEINNHDSIYFRNENIIYCTDLLDLQTKLKELHNIDVVIVDLDEFDCKDICTDIIYLLEPGTIRLNKFLMNNKNFVNECKDKKIVLNRSAIKEEEVHNFERETGINVFYNLGNFNDRLERIKSVDELLIKLGFDKQEIKKGFLSKL